MLVLLGKGLGVGKLICEIFVVGHKGVLHGWLSDEGMHRLVIFFKRTLDTRSLLDCYCLRLPLDNYRVFLELSRWHFRDRLDSWKVTVVAGD